MTEYDYSPEAYEKYLATQSRVSNWVSDQVSHRPYYSSPSITPSNSPSHVSAIAPQPVRAAQHYSQLHPLRIPDSRPQPRSSPPKSSSRRSHTSPPPPPIPPPNPSQYYHRAAVEQPRPAPIRTATLPNSHMYRPAPPPMQLAMRPAAHMAYLPPPPPGYKAEYRSYNYDPTRNEIALPPMRPGETYVIVPPRRGTIEVVRDTGSHTRSASRNSGSARSQSKKSTPLFRRILGSISPTGNGNGPSAVRAVYDNPPPRRLRRHSTSHI